VDLSAHGISVRWIELILGAGFRPVASARITVREWRERPPGVPEAPLVAYVYLSVETENVDPGSVETVRMQFRVEEAWISNRGIDPGSIRLVRFDGRWENVATEFAGRDDLYRYYVATMPRLSMFVIGGQQLPPPPPPPPAPIEIPVPVWVGLSALGAAAVLFLYTRTWTYRIRRLNGKINRVTRGKAYERARRRLSRLRVRLAPAERAELERLLRTITGRPVPRVKPVPLRERLAKPELEAVELLERFIRERRARAEVTRRAVRARRKLGKEEREALMTLKELLAERRKMAGVPAARRRARPARRRRTPGRTGKGTAETGVRGRSRRGTRTARRSAAVKKRVM